jgi:hypothetical protein
MEDLGLAEAIEAVRAQLREAQNAGRGSDVRFALGDIELEFVVDATKTAGGDASIKVLSVLSLGGKGEIAKGETSRVNVKLTPIGVNGQPFEVSSPSKPRPDGGANE